MKLQHPRPIWTVPLLVAALAAGAWVALARDSAEAARLPAEALVAAPGAQSAPIVKSAATNRGSAGCASHKRQQEASSEERTLTSAGLNRTYRVHTPASTETSDPPALVLLFHGRGSSAAAIERESGLLALADQYHFALVSPDGTGSSAGWGAGASMSTWPVNDVQFSKELLAKIASDECVDLGRVYATGHSNGAFMASRLACALPGQIAAIAPVAGAYLPADPCLGNVPILAIHGTADLVVPFKGGMVRDVYAYKGVQAEMDRWATADGCATGASQIAVTRSITVERWTGCRAAVELVMVNGGNHSWPQITDLPGEAGSTSTAQVIWDFFRDKTAAAK